MMRQLPTHKISKLIERGQNLGIPYRRFGKTEWNVSGIGLGCAPWGDIYGTISHAERLKILQSAFGHGINILDTSPYYGETKSESNLGVCLSELARDGTEHHQRDQYIVCTKVGRYANGKHDYSAQRIESSIQESLQRLQTDYIDCIFVHDLEFVGYYPGNENGSLEQIWSETLPALQEQQDKGFIGAYGLSGRPLICLDYVARQYGYDKLAAILTYNNYNLTDERLNLFAPRFQKHDIGVLQGGVTLMGLLTVQGPQQWNNAPPIIKQKCHEAVQYVHEHCRGDKQEKKDAILRLSFLHALSNANIDSILVGSTSHQQLESNIKWILDSKEYRIYDDDYLTVDDKQIIHHLQHEVFADVMNLGWIEDGTYYNICEASFDSPNWKQVLHHDLHEHDKL